CSTGTTHSQSTTQPTFSKFTHARRPLRIRRPDTTQRFSGEMMATLSGKAVMPIPTMVHILIRLPHPTARVSGKFQFKAGTLSLEARFNGIAGTHRPSAHGVNPPR